MESGPLLEVRDLTVSFRGEAGALRAVDGVSFDVWRGKTLALVGESGCGKTVTALSILRLLHGSSGSIESGAVLFAGTDLTALSAAEMRRVRGDRISMIFQEPMTAMNPLFTVGAQISEVLRIHRHHSRSAAREASIALLRSVGIAEPERRIDEYPFQFSGGMLQRAMIAMALACQPELLIADEPTTALDVTIQAQILDLILELQQSLGTSILLITHDLAVVAEAADEVAIMYAGRIAERGPTMDVLADPRHPYTQGLIASMPGPDDDKTRPLAAIPGSVPTLGQMPQGCRFHPRCAYAEEVCRTAVPALEPFAPNREVSCHLAAAIHELRQRDAGGTIG